MAAIPDTRLKEMEEEMNRFEEEILSSGAEVKIPQAAPLHTNSHGGSSMRYSTSMQPSHPPVGFHPPPMFIPPQLKNRPMPPPPRPMHPMVPMPGNFPVNVRPFGQPPFPPRPHHLPMFGPQPPQILSKQPEISIGQKSQTSSTVVISAPKIVYSAPPIKNQPEGVTVKQEEKPLPPPVIVTVASPPPKEPEKKPPKPQSSKPKDSSKSSSVPSTSEGKRDKKDRKKKYMRMAAGTIWEDPSLTEWDPDDFRLFCGDLGNEVTDDVLNRVFAKFPSFQKARVIRDKRTNKTKGYGFASFKDPGDFMKAMRELNGKYVGNRPIKLRKSCWQDRQVENVKRKEKEKKKLGFR